MFIEYFSCLFIYFFCVLIIEISWELNNMDRKIKSTASSLRKMGDSLQKKQEDKKKKSSSVKTLSKSISNNNYKKNNSNSKNNDKKKKWNAAGWYTQIFAAG